MARSKQGSVVERKRKNGKTQLYARIRWTERIGGKTVRQEKLVRVKTRSDGRAKCKQLLRELEDDGPQIFDGKKMAFDKLADKYEAVKVIDAEYRGDTKIRGMRSPKSAKAQLKTLKAFFGDTPAGAIDAEMVLEFKHHRLRQRTRRKTAVKEATVNRELERLRAVFNYAKRKRWLKESPFDFDYDEPIISKANELRRDRLPTDEEERLLLEGCTGRRAHLRPILICLSDTGMRLSEALRLTWEDVYFDDVVIRLKPRNTKTLKQRWIGMTERLREEMAKLWESSLKDPRHLVFGIKSNVKRSFSSLCDEKKIADLQIRDFRNKTSTDYKLANIPTELAMKGTGHTQHRTYEGYVKVDQAIARQLAQDLEKFRIERQKKPEEKAKGEQLGEQQEKA